MDTMVFVTEVPMLAPMMIGMAWGTDTTLAPTRPTTILVLVEEDWTRTVAKMPTIRPAMGLLVTVKSSPAFLPPSALKAAPIKSRPKRKQYSARSTPKIFKVRKTANFAQLCFSAMATKSEICLVGLSSLHAFLGKKA